MGFYGNITNTSNTTFQFDRIYPNRLSMDANTNNDGIFIGRYVLVEYDQDAAISNIYIDTNNVISFNDKDCYFGYTLSSFENTSKIEYGGTQRTNVNLIDKYYLGEFGQVQKIENKYGTLIDVIEFYQCVGEQDGYALFTYVAKSNQTESEYIKNFAIDEEYYHEKKGYDSTVWVKTTEKNSNDILITKYVNIADLNSVVPTFDIATDAPTMEPIAAHFDADSTNVYYKLHVQQPFGFRVKEAEKDETSGMHINTDETTTHYITKYNKNKNETETVVIKDVPADIYFNEAGFQEFTPNQNVGEKPNFIKIEPSGKSNDYETKYSHTSKGQTSENKQVGDIQEFSLHLPAIGNMMSDAWDIIHGKERNDYRGDGENASLQGRLDAFEDIKINQIPVKREKDGTLVGSMINHATPYVLPEGKDILSEEAINAIPENIYDGDDPWIATSINTDLLVGGQQLNENGEIVGEYDQTGNSGISIHHSFHPIHSSQSGYDQNTRYYDETDPFLQLNKLQCSNKYTNWDEIQLYVPYVDARGHVVGENIETIVLPYGYKYFQTNGLSDKKEDIYSTNVNGDGITETKSTGGIENDVEAHNTQDILSINPANKWIQTKLVEMSEGIGELTIAHEIHSIDVRDSAFGDNESSHSNANEEEGAIQEDNLTIYDWSYDEAGHITSKRKHTYTLPYSYKTIKVANNSNGVAAPASTVMETGQSADQTQDTLNLNASNKWIVLDNAEDDIIKFGHKLSDLPKGWHSSSDTTIKEFGQSFKILKYETDEAGHVIDNGEDVITIPQGSYTAASGASESKEIITSIGFTPSSGAITSTKANTDTLSLSNYSANTNEHSKLIDIVDTDTINNAFKKIQNHINGLNLNVNETTDDTKIITGIVQKNGQVSLSRSTAGNLQIGTPSTDGTIPADSSLNNAFNIINNRIKAEEDALTKEIQDRKDAISSAIAGIFDKNDDNEINKLAEIIEWINNNPSTATEMQTAIQENTNAINEGIKDREALQEQVEDLQNWKESATQDIENLNTTIEQLNDTISKLIERIEKLENPEIETQPDEQPENE